MEPSVYFASVKSDKKFKFASLKERLLCRSLPNEAESFSRPPFDLYCPSMSSKLEKCICSTCGSSWPSEAAMKRHKKCHKIGKNEEEINTFLEVTDEFCHVQDYGDIGDPEKIPVIDDIRDFLASPWEILEPVTHDEFN